MHIAKAVARNYNLACCCSFGAAGHTMVGTAWVICSAVKRGSSFIDEADC